MDRRDFLKSAGAAAAAATTATAVAAESATAQPAAVAAPNLAAGIVELRLATFWPDAVAGPADQARRLGQRLAAMSGGRYRIAFANGIGDGLASVRAGEADLYYASEHDHLGAHRALAYFAGLPGDHGIAARHLSAWMLAGGGQQLWDDLAANFGVKAMLAGHTGEQPCFVASRRVSDMSELAGEKVAVSGLARDVVRGFGLEPVAIPVAHVADALTRGELVAAECGGAITSYALGLLRAASCSAGTSVNRHGSAVSLGIRRSLGTACPRAIKRSSPRRRQPNSSWHSPRRRRTGACSIPHPWPPIPGPWRPSCRARSAASQMRSSRTSPPPTRTRSASMRATRHSGARSYPKRPPYWTRSPDLQLAPGHNNAMFARTIRVS
jgi:TRAP-type mannitol/chloroaromatic compound transport system substrate-binding protein